MLQLGVYCLCLDPVVLYNFYHSVVILFSEDDYVIRIKIRKHEGDIVGKKTSLRGLN